MRLGLAVVLITCLSAHAEDGLAERKRIVEILRCKDVSCVQTLVSSAANKIEGLVAACRTFQLRRNGRSASDVFDALPVTEEQFSWLYRITEPTDGLSDKDLELLNAFYYRTLTRELIAASELAPDRILRLLEYGLVDNDVHSKFAKVAEKVCRARKVEFQRAFENLASEKRQQLQQQVIDTGSCRRVPGEFD